MALFGSKPNAEKEAMAKNLQNLSDQIGALKQQLNTKDSEVTSLQEQLQQAQAAVASGSDAKAEIQRLQGAIAAAEADKQAQAIQMQDLQKQISELQDKLAAAAAATGATAPAEAQAAAIGALTVGATAYVTRAGGLPLRLRNGPGLNHDVVGRLEPGTGMTLLAGPQQADGHAWWQIRTTDGREGWVAGEDLRSQPD